MFAPMRRKSMAKASWPKARAARCKSRTCQPLSAPRIPIRIGQSTLGAREEGALKDFRSDLAEGLASSRLQIMEYDLGRAEKHGIDLVEIMVIALENGGKRLAVVGRSARWHAGADRRNLFIVVPNPDANPAAVQDSIIGPADG